MGIDTFSAVALGSAGSVFLAGHTTGNWSGLNAGEPDFAACKLDTDGKEIWRWQVNVRRHKQTTLLWGALFGVARTAMRVPLRRSSFCQRHSGKSSDARKSSSYLIIVKKRCSTCSVSVLLGSAFQYRSSYPRLADAGISLHFSP